MYTKYKDKLIERVFVEILVAPKLKKFKKIGLAFGGGGARGFAYIGVVRAFEEFGIKFDYIAGTSIGSIMGAMLAYGMTSDEMEKIASGGLSRLIRYSQPLVPDSEE